MPSDEIVDVSGTRIRRRRQFVLRVGVPLLGVALVILSILGVSLYSYQQNRNAALKLSGSILAGLQSRITREATFYLAPATQATLIARDMVARHAISDGRSAIEGYAASMLGQVPHLQGFYAANAAGDFIMVQRDPAGGTRTKIILNPPGKRQVSSVHLDANGQFLDANLAPGDDFDPRTRSWYQGALKTGGVFWSQPYTFYTTKAPGITASIRLIQQGNPDRVFGVDITLEALSSFLGSLHIGISGRAAIVDRYGNLIAAPRMPPALRTQTGDNPAQAVSATMATLADPALTGAFDRFRVEGYGNRTIAIGTERFVSIAAPLPAAGQDWVLLIVAPEHDFTALAQSNSRQHLLLSLITILLAALLGGLLIHQNRRNDRLRHLLAQEKQDGLQETQLLSDLAGQPGLFDRNRPAPGLTESLAEIGSARRASIWRLAGEGRILHCEDQFDTEQNVHSDGMELSRSELPRLFAALDAGETIATQDAARDQRTAELHRLLMRPFGSARLSMLPVRGPTGVAGAMLIEDAQRPDRAQNLAKAVAGIVALRLAGSDDPFIADQAATGTDGVAGAPIMQAAEGSQPFNAELVTPSFAGQAHETADTPHGLAADHFTAVTAMVIRFEDAIALARPDQTGVTALADQIARAMQEIATRFALPYMKITGHELVAATGCTAQPGADPGASARLADAALAARDTCLSLLSQAGFDAVFHIGIDFGSALGGVLGDAPRVFNLWGNAIRTAEQMAQSAPELGTIQVSQAAHDRLRGAFLFRARGVFFIPRTGTTRTFVMAGRR